jgi:hypothetical protein
MNDAAEIAEAGRAHRATSRGWKNKLFAGRFRKDLIRFTLPQPLPAVRQENPATPSCRRQFSPTARKSARDG